jgi:hypothetical protein
LINDCRWNWKSEATTRTKIRFILDVINTIRLHCSNRSSRKVNLLLRSLLVDFVHVGRGRRRSRCHVNSIYTSPSHRQLISLRVSRSIQRSITKYISCTLIVGAASKTLLSTKNTPIRMTQQPATHRRPHTITDKHMNHCHMCNPYTMQVINIPGC